jgi:hypothetical protein
MERRYVVKWADEWAQWEVIDTFAAQYTIDDDYLCRRGLFTTRLNAQQEADRLEGLRVS